MILSLSCQGQWNWLRHNTKKKTTDETAISQYCSITLRWAPLQKQVTFNTPPPRIEMEFVCNFFLTKFFGVLRLLTYIFLNRLHIVVAFSLHNWIHKQNKCTNLEFLDYFCKKLARHSSLPITISYAKYCVSQRVYKESYTKTKLYGV